MILTESDRIRSDFLSGLGNRADIPCFFKKDGGIMPRKKKNEVMVLVHETPAQIYTKLMEEGKKYHLDTNQIYIRAARSAAEEYELIDKIRNTVEAEGMTIEQEYKTGTHLAAHPLLEQLPRHLDCMNRILSSMLDIIEKSGGKLEDDNEDLSVFRMAK